MEVKIRISSSGGNKNRHYNYLYKIDYLKLISATLSVKRERKRNMRPVQMHGHERPITRVRYNKEGDLVFSAGRDKSPNAWFSQTGERLGSFDGHNGAVFDLAVDSKSKHLLTGSGDNTARLWSVETGETVFEWEFKTPVKSVDFAMGDRMAVIMTDQRKDQPGQLHIFAISKDSKNQSDIPMQSITLPGSRATIARWGTLNKVIYTGHEDGTINMWNPLVGTKLKSATPHSDSVQDLQLSHDMTYIVTASKDCTAKVFDAETLKEMTSYKSDRPLNSAAASPLFEQIMVGGGQEARDVTTTSSRAGKFEICFYHRIFENEIGRLKAHFSPINTLAFHPDGKSFVSGAEEGYVRVYHFDKPYFEYRYD